MQGDLFRQCGHHAARSSRAGGDAALSSGTVGQSFEPVPAKDARPARPSKRLGSQVAELLGAEPGEILFTSSGTEADNLALQGAVVRRGLARLAFDRQRHRASGCVGMLSALGAAGRGGHAAAGRCRRPGRSGRVGGALRPDTRLVSVMAANNVTGEVQPIAELGRVAAGMACCFTATRCRPSAACRWMCGRLRSRSTGDFGP